MIADHLLSHAIPKARYFNVAQCQKPILLHSHTNEDNQFMQKGNKTLNLRQDGMGPRVTCYLIKPVFHVPWTPGPTPPTGVDRITTFKRFRCCRENLGAPGLEEDVWCQEIDCYCSDTRWHQGSDDL